MLKNPAKFGHIFGACYRTAFIRFIFSARIYTTPLTTLYTCVRTNHNFWVANMANIAGDSRGSELALACWAFVNSSRVPRVQRVPGVP